MEKEAVTINVYGKVQGVGFRFYTNRKANELDICGFVQNMADGSVYIEAEGDPVKLEQFVAWCHEGPAWARVSDVSIQKTPPAGFSRFNIR